MKSYQQLKNIAIIAHVDHGKTTLIDGLLKHSQTLGKRTAINERVMDSDELEKERGITIKAKNCSIYWNDTKVNLLDTPGHADFGGEVERSLLMVDGVLLLVDAAEGPLPQTRFVLQKALELNLKVAVIINKIDRPDERTEEVKHEIEDLFLELASHVEHEDVQLDVPIIYASAKQEIAKNSLEEEGKNLVPILEFISSNFFPTPQIAEGPHLQLQITNLSYSPYLGPLVIGRIKRGSIKKSELYTLHGKNNTKNSRVTSIKVFDGLEQHDLEEAHAGEIVIVAGFENTNIGDTLCSIDQKDPLPRIEIEPPTVSVNVSVNTSPFSGKDGEYLTSRKLEEFLEESCKHNVALKYETTDDPKIFKLKGRGELQLAIVFEELRRKGFEFMVSRPEVVIKTNPETEEKTEPFEKVVIDIPSTATGTVTEKLSIRKGKLTSMLPIGDNRTRLEFVIPTRGMIGYRSIFLTDTKGEGILSSYFIGFEPFAGNMLSRQNGAIIADRNGKTTPYALFNLLSSGKQFILPGEEVYEGMIIGEHNRTNDLNVNVVREKHLSCVRTAGKDENIILPSIPKRTLDWALDWIENDEWIEVTPKILRIRKKELKQNQRSVIRR